MEGKIPLDFLEMQYYRHLINESSLRNHLHQSNNRIRYAWSCRDLTGTIPQDLVALHAAIGSRALRTAVAKEGASIAIWQADSNNLSVKGAQVDAAEMIEQQLVQVQETVCTSRKKDAGYGQHVPQSGPPAYKSTSTARFKTANPCMMSVPKCIPHICSVYPQ